MNSDLIPAFAAAGGGSALISGIWGYEHRRDGRMRMSRTRLALRFPIGLEPIRAFAALDGLSGLPYTTELIAEIAASEGAIEHYIWVPAAVRSSVRSILGGVVGSLRITEAPPSPSEAVTLALRLFIPTPSVLSADNATEASRALLAGLAGLGSGEQVVVRWALSPGASRPARALDTRNPRAREIDHAWRRKTAAAGFSASGLVLVRAAKMGRARPLAAHIENMVRSRQALVGGVRVTAGRGNRTLAAMPRNTRTSGWLSTAELLPLLGWPLGAELVPGVTVGAARELMVPRQIPRKGRRLFIGHDVHGERPVSVSAEAARHHMAVIGPSGVGKSVLLARCVLDDLAQGFGGVVIDPKGPDLVNTILDRVPPEAAERIAVLDVADDTRPVGLDVLKSGDPDRCAEMLVGALKSIFPDWGIRSETYGRLSIRTLAEVPGATLADMGRLFFEEPYRRAAVGRLSDPFLLSAWQSFEHLSPAAQAEHVQAPMAKVFALLSQPRLRAVLANADARLDIAQLLAERKWLLVSLSPGVLGETTASFVGAALMYAIWSAIEGRAALPPEQRHPVFLYLDELATLTGGLPYSFELLAERARGLGAGLTVSLQTIGRIGEPTRGSLLGNTASLISFRAGAEEAPRLARELPGLSAQDLMALAPFEVAARVGTGVGSAVAVMTGRTEPLPPPTAQAEAIREASAERYGSPLVEPDPTSEPPDPSDTTAPVGQKRRRA
jgi:hypothetical protein